MMVVFTQNGWEDYLYWQTEDKKIINDISRNGNSGLGKPEPLKGNLSGYWSRRIDDVNRLVYKIDTENVYILSCRYHYE